MSSIGSQNPFAPPRALVDDQIDTQIEMIEATRGSRFAAAIIDVLALMGIAAIVGILAAIALPAYAAYQKRALGSDVPASVGGSVIAIVIGLVVLVSIVGIFVYTGVLVYRYGQTIGKRMMGIRVVRTDGSRVAFGRFIFLRWLPIALLGMIPLVGYIVTLVDVLLIFRDNRLCVHDNIADTKVVTAASSEGATLAGSSGAQLRTISF
ncbi:MAG: RDD family protein [Betaproteobacteria bacterium]